ncbi:hypothetical protein PENVUL_c001G08669 [Penicillium vulpinum]|uniref:Uncharacterized protein n=1 Tax=Penicillium vulpinum TaxID=29845 RepID=A0A1V6SE38_9EURO|nr:hypothetical protein PENVUL_c001G08669 [Penicillium vulpinum]
MVDVKTISDTLEDLLSDYSTVSTTPCSSSTTATTIGYPVIGSTNSVPSFNSTTDTQILCFPDTCEQPNSTSTGPLGSDTSTPYSSYVRNLAPIWIDQLGSVSAQWFDYPLFGHSAVGVKGIYGCTAVIIASEKGVYISHIWESPVFVDQEFNPTDDNLFTINAFNSLRDGTIHAQSVTDLIGTDQNPGVLNAIYAPKVFVLTPFTTDWDRQYFSISTILRYQTRVQELAQKIANIVPGSGGNGIILGYTRTSRQASSQERGIAGRAILEIDPFYTWLTTPYDSKSSGLQIGRWRLWVEDHLITYQDFWLPNLTAPRGNF